jgi:hypothetical protein
LEDTQEFFELPEFRDAFYETVSEADVFEVEINAVNESGIPFVTLWSPQFEDSVNKTVLQKTISAFPKPAPPKVTLNCLLQMRSFGGTNNTNYGTSP